MRSMAVELDLGHVVDEIRHHHPCVAMAIGVVTPEGSQVAVSGPADIGSREAATAQTAFRVASITKTFTAVGLIQLWEQGLVDLDAPAENYLQTIRLGGKMSNPVTVRQLLTHTSGLPETLSVRGLVRPDFGESYAPTEAAPTLAEFYGRRLDTVTDPGTTFCYTNHGPALIGQILEDVTGQALEDYLVAHVFAPWGMTGSDLSQSRRPRAGRATGYRLTSRGPKAVAVRDMVTAGAAAAWSTPADMVHYLEALLGGGRNEHGAALHPDTLDFMFAPHYQPDPRIPGMGLGFMRGEVDGHKVVEHQGIIPGFDSHLILAPDDGAGVFAVTTGARLAMFWLQAETSRLLRRLIGAGPDIVPTDVPQRPDVWPELCGRYWVPGTFRDLRLRSIVGAGVQVRVRGGRLVLGTLNPVPTLFKGVELLPGSTEDPYCLRFDLTGLGLGTGGVVFDPDSSSGDTAMHLELMPLTAYRRSRRELRKRWSGGAR